MPVEAPAVLLGRARAVAVGQLAAVGVIRPGLVGHLIRRSPMLFSSRLQIQGHSKFNKVTMAQSPLAIYVSSDPLVGHLLCS